ncbi:MAG: hypothetical protein ACR2LE_02720, partial [Nocardioidaceae bacterium]
VVTHQVPTDWVEAHPDAPFTFVTDGVETAIARAQEIAGDLVVTVSGGTIARQALELGLLDGSCGRPGACRHGPRQPTLLR